MAIDYDGEQDAIAAARVREKRTRRMAAIKQLNERIDKAVFDSLSEIYLGIGMRLKPNKNMVDAITSGLLDRGLDVYPTAFFNDPEAFSGRYDRDLHAWYADYLEANGDPVD